MKPAPIDDERSEIPEEPDTADPSEKVPSAPELPIPLEEPEKGKDNITTVETTSN